MALNLGALAGGFAEHAGEELLTFAIGAAAAEALRPEAVELGQEAWKLNPVRVLGRGDAAAAVAEGLLSQAAGAGEAEGEGVNGDRFATMVELAQTAPGLPMLLTLWRRGDISDADLLHGLRKAKLEPRWDQAVQSLKVDRLEPAVIATAGQRGVMDDAGLLPVGPPSEVGVVAPMPTVSLDPIAEAAASGVDRERLAVLMRIVGLPPSPGELLQLLNRGTIHEADFLRGIAEGNTRNEWADVLMTLRRRILTPHDYVEGRLRGWIDTPAMHAGAALSGVTADDADLLFKIGGRPIPVHQVVTGEARGGAYNGPIDGIPDAILRSLEESNIRPEWYSLAHANRYTYPSAFVVRQLQRDQAISEADAEHIYLAVGWPPELATAVAKAYSAPASSTADTHEAKAANQLWTATHRSFVVDETTEQEALAALTTIGVAPAARPRVVELWTHERGLIRKTLTPAQVKKAVKAGRMTEAEALGRLTDQGLSAGDAATLLAE